MRHIIQWNKKPLTSEENRIANFILAILFAIIITSVCTLIYMFNLYFGHMQIYCTDDFEISEYIAEIQRVPERVQKSFIINLGTVSIEKEAIEEHNKQTGTNSVGMYSFGGNKIWLLKSNATLHEFGHYVNDHLNEDYTARIESCYEKEGTQHFDSRALANNTKYIYVDGKQTVYLKDDEILGYSEKIDSYPADEYYYDFIQEETPYPQLGQYATTSSKEYFAEYFQYWIKNKANTKEMEKLRKATPETYALFEELEDNDWGMINTLKEKILDKLVTIKYE